MLRRRSRSMEARGGIWNDIFNPGNKNQVELVSLVLI